MIAIILSPSPCADDPNGALLPAELATNRDRKLTEQLNLCVEESFAGRVLTNRDLLVILGKLMRSIFYFLLILLFR